MVHALAFSSAIHASANHPRSKFTTLPSVFSFLHPTPPWYITQPTFLPLFVPSPPHSPFPASFITNEPSPTHRLDIIGCATFRHHFKATPIPVFVYRARSPSDIRPTPLLLGTPHQRWCHPSAFFAPLDMRTGAAAGSEDGACCCLVVRRETLYFDEGEEGEGEGRRVA